jgi:thiol-disulfide isomerase/thioredoxin
VTLLQLNRDDEGIEQLRIYLQRDGTGPQANDARRLIENPKRARADYAPDFSFKSRQGERVTRASLQGKAVLLDFWGSWCKPCVEATPGLAKIARKFSESPFVILGIAQDKAEDWNRFIDKNKMDWPQYLDERREIAELFKIQGYPTYIILDTEGIIQARRMGYSGATDGWIEAEIKKALKIK